MSTVLEAHNLLKHRVTLAILTLTTLGATIAALGHRLEPNPHQINLIAPPLLAIAAPILI